MSRTGTRTAVGILSAGLWLLSVQGDAFAQFGTSGQTGTQRSSAGSATGRATTGAATTGATRTNTSTRASSAGGRAATGRGGGGASNFGETSSLSLDTGATGTQVFGSGMVGRGAQPGGFIGNANAAGGVGLGGRGAPQQFGRTGGFGGPVGFGSGGFGQPGGFGGNFRGNGGLGNNLRGGPSTSLGEFRPQMRIAFPRTSVPPVAVRASIAPSLVRLQESLPGTQNLSFDVGDAGVVTVRGVVPTDADRRIAIRMLEMEPGVREVNDQLTVAATE